ncbi:hypothetical protein [Rosettibacter firmus]|uniref:hypothetical protein n=1 Tax=Rosettibacter firmus TaxID=3111522 RepID=UPI00336BF08A
MKKYHIIFLSFLFVFFLIILSIHFFYRTPVQTYTFSYICSSIIFLILSIIILKYEFGKNIILISALSGIILRISFITTTPIGSDDIYRYMWDGKVQSMGINPYQYAPIDSNLASLHSDILPAKVNFPNLKTIYFPFSQWIFFIGYNLSGEHVWGYKLLLLIFDLFTILTLYNVLKLSEKSTKLILLYILCPLPTFQFAIDSHLDGYGLLLIVLSILFYYKKKLSLSLIFLGLSFSIKPVGILLMPILFFREKLVIDKLKIIFIPFITFFVQFIPYIFSSNPFESLFIYAKHWSFNGSIFSLLNSFIEHNQKTRIVCAILFLLTLIPVYFKKFDSIKKFYYSILLLFIFSPVVHPWYISWLTVLIPLIPVWSGIMYSSLSSLTAFTILSYQLNGVWKEYTLVLLVEYIPVILFMLLELGLFGKITNWKQNNLLFRNIMED